MLKRHLRFWIFIFKILIYVLFLIYTTKNNNKNTKQYCLITVCLIILSVDNIKISTLLIARQAVHFILCLNRAAVNFYLARPTNFNKFCPTSNRAFFNPINGPIFQPLSLNHIFPARPNWPHIPLSY